MANRAVQFLLAVTTLLVGLLLTRAPLMMTAEAPRAPWADGPMKLITTPQYETKRVSLLPPVYTSTRPQHTPVVDKAQCPEPRS